MKMIELSSRRKFCKESILYLGGGAFFLLPANSVFEKLGYSRRQTPKFVKVASKDERYYGWPANNGMWSWDKGQEILVGFTDGPFDTEGGFHSIGNPRHSKLARSKDGGETWSIENPDNFVGSSGGYKTSSEIINFGHPDFAMRISSTGYHGNNDTLGHFYISYDRGHTWDGGFRFNGLQSIFELDGMEITSRTNYLVTGDKSIQIFMTARNPDLKHSGRRDKTFVLESTDGGANFNFISWVVPWSEQDNRAAMPSGVRTKDGKLVVAVRVRNPFDNDIPCWIDCYVSENNGRSWDYLSKIGETGYDNGNPPALTVLVDGRLACCFANRDLNQLIVRYSSNGGKSWNEEFIVRENPYTNDMGYPQLLQNSNGDLVAIYYIATEEHQNNYIEAAIWKP